MKHGVNSGSIGNIASVAFLFTIDIELDQNPSNQQSEPPGKVFPVAGKSVLGNLSMRS